MNIDRNYRISAEKNHVIKVFSDLEKYGRLHPLIISVQIIANNGKEYEEFEITERPYPWVPIQIKYRAKVYSKTDKIEYIISGIPLSKVSVKYDFSETNEQETDVVFKLKIDGIFIVKNVLAKKMVKAQDMLMQSINKELTT